MQEQAKPLHGGKGTASDKPSTGTTTTRSASQNKRKHRVFSLLRRIIFKAAHPKSPLPISNSDTAPSHETQTRSVGDGTRSNQGNSKQPTGNPQVTTSDHPRHTGHTPNQQHKIGRGSNGRVDETKEDLDDQGIDLRNTTDVDQVTAYAPGKYGLRMILMQQLTRFALLAVVHETILPEVHEIREEQIYREIHTHDVHHQIQPIHHVEVLPARHWVPGPNGSLVEISEQESSSFTGPTKRTWNVVES